MALHLLMAEGHRSHAGFFCFRLRMVWGWIWVRDVRESGPFCGCVGLIS
jgi:hypothetical protein